MDYFIYSAILVCLCSFAGSVCGIIISMILEKIIYGECTQLFYREGFDGINTC